MNTFTAKSSAVRAAAAHFKVNRNMAEVLKVATIHQNTMNEWFWKPIAKKVVKPEPKVFKTARRIEKEARETKAQSTEQVAKPKKVWKRPGPGTLTGKVWVFADEFKTRALVLDAAKREGLNMGMASQQFFRWSQTHGSRK